MNFLNEVKIAQQRLPKRQKYVNFTDHQLALFNEAFLGLSVDLRQTLRREIVQLRMKGSVLSAIQEELSVTSAQAVVFYKMAGWVLMPVNNP